MAAVAKGLLPHEVDAWINVAEPFLAFLGVWAVPNSPEK